MEPHPISYYDYGSYFAYTPQIIPLIKIYDLDSHQLGYASPSHEQYYEKLFRLGNQLLHNFQQQSGYYPPPPGRHQWLFYDNDEFLIVPIASGPPTLPNYHPAFLPALHLSQNPAPLEKITQEGTPNQETNPVAESNSNM
ncbi:hypothetical protein B9Z55_023714 [Caenorhabditis nigoni]|uniref:Uncharacterized protein n=1 Tax=Caenorhabditis nigoni TaxID=1611254 RepID=A0A2G5SQY2_9PELO|nr:hypothetical protein B9Z55_023714 [Caenorhabditis nigoni]